MDNSFDHKKSHELVLYQAVMHRTSESHSTKKGQPLLTSPAVIPFRPMDMNPGIRRIFERLQRHIFYGNHWWSVIHPDKGLVIDLFI